jgi:Domain of unknown function (DUF4386)
MVRATVGSLSSEKGMEGEKKIMPQRLSIQAYARIAGVLFVVSLVAGGFGEGFAPSQLIVTGDAAATTRHILNSDALFRVGFASYLVEALCDVALTAIFYVLLRPVNPIVTFGIVLFRLMATATFAFGELFYFAPSLILGNDTYLKSFSPEQLNALTLLSLNLYGVGGAISLVFYGVASIGIGYLMFRSGYFPRILGVLWAIGGAGFVLRTFAYVLVPGIPTVILQAPQILAILILAIWLIAKGVNAATWEARAQAQAAILLT